MKYKIAPDGKDDNQNKKINVKNKNPKPINQQKTYENAQKLSQEFTNFIYKHYFIAIIRFVVQFKTPF